MLEIHQGNRKLLITIKNLQSSNNRERLLLQLMLQRESKQTEITGNHQMSSRLEEQILIKTLQPLKIVIKLQRKRIDQVDQVQFMRLHFRGDFQNK